MGKKIDKEDKFNVYIAIKKVLLIILLLDII